MKGMIWNVLEKRKGKSCWLWNVYKTLKCYMFKKNTNIWNAHMKGIYEMPHKRNILKCVEKRKGKVESSWVWNVYKKLKCYMFKKKGMFEISHERKNVKCVRKEILWNVSEERKGKVESCWLTRWYFSPTPMYSSVGLPSWTNNHVPEIRFAIWEKYFLQFKTNTFVNIGQILLCYSYVLLSGPAIREQITMSLFILAIFFEIIISEISDIMT